jgi:hypothetical protein
MAATIRSGPASPLPRDTPCPRRETPQAGFARADKYAHLLGLCRGDGCVSPVRDPTKRVWASRVSCADAYPGLKGECVEASVPSVRTTKSAAFN